MMIPALLLLYYVHIFGVNGVFSDEWTMIRLFEKMMNGNLTFSDLFALHNEHRVFFPRIAILILGILTRYNTIAQMVLCWVLISLTGLIIFQIYRRKFSDLRYFKLALIFLPVSFLLFSFRQYESILGEIITTYLLIFGAVATFSLLEVSKKIDRWFILSFVTAILASFSMIIGLLVWPVGFIQIIMVKGRQRLEKTASWICLSILIFASYFYRYSKPSYHPQLSYMFENPFDGGLYLVTLIGAPLSYEKISAAAIGSLLILIAIYIIVQASREKLLRINAVWLSLILFSALSVLAITLGRSGFGWEQALTSRYIPVATLGITGLYFLAVSTHRIKTKSFGAHFMLTLILLGTISSYGVGWYVGEKTMYAREMGAYTLETYDVQTDQRIRSYLLFKPQEVRKLAGFLETNRLNVFAKEEVDTSKITMNSDSTRSTIDTINGEKLRSESPVLIDRKLQETIIIAGWAVDSKANDVASAVFIVINGEMNIPTVYGIERVDIAQAYNNPNFKNSGYFAIFSSSILDEGENTISLKIVSKDGTYFYDSEKTVLLIVS